MDKKVENCNLSKFSLKYLEIWFVFLVINNLFKIPIKNAILMCNQIRDIQ